MQSFGLAGTQKLRGVRMGLGESWVRWFGGWLARTGLGQKTLQPSPLPERRLSHFGFAVANRRGTAIERRRHVYQRGKGCQAVPFRRLESGAD
jgi:hypothetical protein